MESRPSRGARRTPASRLAILAVVAVAVLALGLAAIERSGLARRQGVLFFGLPDVRFWLSGHLVRIGRDQLAKRLAVAYVEEVGRAAIDLYSGRSRGAMLAGDSQDAGITAETRAAMRRFS